LLTQNLPTDSHLEEGVWKAKVNEDGALPGIPAPTRNPSRWASEAGAIFKIRRPFVWKKLFVGPGKR